MGGDCLNVGCVPSKALLAAARGVADARRLAELGGRAADVGADFPAVMERLRRLRAGIAPHDGAARFASLGVDVFLGEARFSGPDRVDVGGRTLRFKKAVIATGARAAVPVLPGLAEAGFLTNETVFTLTALPPRLVVLGGGPIGCELAQAFARLGSKVTLVASSARLLPKDVAAAGAWSKRRYAATASKSTCALAPPGAGRRRGHRGPRRGQRRHAVRELRQGARRDGTSSQRRRPRA